MKTCRVLTSLLFAFALLIPLGFHSGIAQEKNTGSNTPDAASDAGENSKKLTVASWGGAYSEAQKRAFIEDFEKQTGIKVTLVSHKGRFDPLIGSSGQNATRWDVVDTGGDILETACEGGKLQKLDPSALEGASEETSAKEDFLPGSLHDCGIASVAWSMTIAYRTTAYRKKKPTSASDFFDVKRFPGKRAIPEDPQYVLELALMADGVKPDQVYEELASDAGLDRAFRVLDRIEGQALWWTRGREPLKLLANGKAAMALAYNGRIFNAIVAENRPLDIIWEGQVYNIESWAIPSTTRNQKGAMQFISFATRPQSLARQANWFPYGPMRKSAIGKVSKHPEIDIEMSGFIPTAPGNFKIALKRDTQWWKRHGSAIRARYTAWRIGDSGTAENGLDAERDTLP